MEVGSFVFTNTLSKHSKSVNSVAFNHDGSRLASGSNDHTIKVWDMEIGGALIRTLEGHDKGVLSVAYNHDGSKIASGCGDKYIKIWNMEDGDALTLAGHSGSVNSVAYNHDGSRLVSGSSDKTIKIWDINNGGTLLYTLTGHDEEVTSVAYNHDGSRLVSGSKDETIKIWNDEGSLLHILISHTDWVNSVAYNYDGSRLVSSSYDKTIKIWNMEDGGALLNSYKDNDVVSSVAFNHDGSSLVSGSYETVTTWNVHKVLKGEQSLEERQVLERHMDVVRSVAYNHDGSKVVSGSADRTIIVWTVCRPGTVSDRDGDQCVPSNEDQTQDNTTKNSTITTKDNAVHIRTKNSSTTVNVAKGLGVAIGVFCFLWTALHCVKNRCELPIYFCYRFLRCFMYFKCYGAKHVEDTVSENKMINVQPENVIT